MLYIAGHRCALPLGGKQLVCQEHSAEGILWCDGAANDCGNACSPHGCVKIEKPSCSNGIMGRRREPRREVAVPVQIWGIDADGKHFMQSAITANVSRAGAQLTGVAVRLRVGDILRVQCGDTKANFKIIWVGIPSTPWAGRVGLQTVLANRYIWKQEPPADRPDNYQIPVEQDQRRDLRYEAALKVGLQEDGSKIPSWA